MLGPVRGPSHLHSCAASSRPGLEQAGPRPDCPALPRAPSERILKLPGNLLVKHGPALRPGFQVVQDRCCSPSGDQGSGWSSVQIRLQPCLPAGDPPRRHQEQQTTLLCPAPDVVEVELQGGGREALPEQR